MRTHDGGHSPPPPDIGLDIYAEVLPSDELRILRAWPALLRLVSSILGSPATPGHGDVLRIKRPGERTRPHQDGAYLSTDPPLLTAWLAMKVAAVARNTSGRRSSSGAMLKNGLFIASKVSAGSIAAIIAPWPK